MPEESGLPRVPVGFTNIDTNHASTAQTIAAPSAIRQGVSPLYAATSGGFGPVRARSAPPLGQPPAKRVYSGDGWSGTGATNPLGVSYSSEFTDPTLPPSHQGPNAASGLLSSISQAQLDPTQRRASMRPPNHFRQAPPSSQAIFDFDLATGPADAVSTVQARQGALATGGSALLASHPSQYAPGGGGSPHHSRSSNHSRQSSIPDTNVSRVPQASPSSLSSRLSNPRSIPVQLPPPPRLTPSSGHGQAVLPSPPMLAQQPLNLEQARQPQPQPQPLVQPQQPALLASLSLASDLMQSSRPVQPAQFELPDPVPQRWSQPLSSMTLAEMIQPVEVPLLPPLPQHHARQSMQQEQLMQDGQSGQQTSVDQTVDGHDAANSAPATVSAGYAVLLETLRGSSSANQTMANARADYLHTQAQVARFGLVTRMVSMERQHRFDLIHAALMILHHPDVSASLRARAEWWLNHLALSLINPSTEFVGLVTRLQEMAPMLPTTNVDHVADEVGDLFRAGGLPVHTPRRN